MSILNEPLVWEDADISPPSSWESIEADGRFWFANVGSSTVVDFSIEYIGVEPLPTTLTFAWEIVEPPSGDNITLRVNNGITTQQFNLGSIVGSGTVEVSLGTATSLRWWLTGQGHPSFFYDGVVAVTGVPDGIEYGAVINIVEKDVLDSFSASWTRPTTKVPGPDLDYYKSYAMDPNDPLAFWLWPRGYAGADVIVTYAAIPASVTATTATLTLSDMYVPDLVDYLAYRALSKDARAGAKVLAQQFREAFLMRLGAGRQILRQIGQNAARAPDAEA
jgi:hypothetical protein